MKPAASEALRELTALIAPGHTAVAKRIAREAADPWLELVDALTEERTLLACSIDWKFAAEDIAANLEWLIAAQAKLRKSARDGKLYDKKKLFAFYDEDQHLLTKTIDFIRLCGRAFSAHGLALVELDISSDSYELTLLPWKDLAAAVSLAKKAGGRLIVHAPKTPVAKPLPTPAPKPRGPAKLSTVRFGWQVRENNFVQNTGFLHWKDVKKDVTATSIVDCRSWPPKMTRAGQGRLDVIIHPDSGARILHRVMYLYVHEKLEPRPKGTLRIETPGVPAIDLLDRLPDQFEIAAAAWIGDLAVFFPTEATIRGKLGFRPLVWNGKRLAPAKGLPDAKPVKGTPRDRFPRFLRQGFARTGEGVDVLVWEGAGWIAKGDAFVRAYAIDRDVSVHELFVGAPAPGDGFFYVHRLPGKSSGIATLRHVERGSCTERLRMKQVVANPPRTAFDGRVIFGLNRYANAKKPVLAVFHPETNELTLVPPHVLAVKKDDQLDAYGVTSSKKDGAFLWVLDDDVVRRIAWDAILALPRTTVH
jgi:hypothetical protein